VFPRLSLDLPRYVEKDEYYASLLKEAKENLERETNKQDLTSMSTPRKKKEEDEITFHGIEVSADFRDRIANKKLLYYSKVRYDLKTQK